MLTEVELKDRMKAVKLLSLDVDGVLTDGGMYYTDDGQQLRRFNVKDGMGIKLAQAAGLEICIISASKTQSIHHRADTLAIKHVRLGADDKIAALNALCDQLAITLDQVAHIGDDVNDLPILERIGLPLTVNDAMDSVKEVAAYVASKNGGCGAVREICDMLVAAREG